MTQEDKNLLLTDLCARLPYGVTAYASEINKNGIITDVNIPHNMVNLTVDNTNGRYELVSLLDIKPYLRPMSSMTEEEKLHVELRYGFFYHDGVLDNVHIFETMGTYDRDGNYDQPSKYREQRRVTIEQVLDFIHWLNVHHFDYCGLIEKGLALEAPINMYI